jgi:hypothetical protein
MDRLGLTEDKKRDELVIAISIRKVAHAKNFNAANGERVYIHSWRQLRGPIQEFWCLPA